MNQIIFIIIIFIVIAVFGYFVWPMPYLSTRMHDNLLKEDHTEELITGEVEPEGKRGESFIKYIDKTKNIIDNINKEQQNYMDKVD